MKRRKKYKKLFIYSYYLKYIFVIIFILNRYLKFKPTDTEWPMWLVVAHMCATVNATGFGYDPHSRTLNIKYFHFLVVETRLNAALNSATQNAECLQNSAGRGERK